MAGKRSYAFVIRFFLWAVILAVLLHAPSIYTSGHGDIKISVPESFYPHLSIAEASSEPIDSQQKWPHEKSDLLPDPALVFGRLPNGFRYVLMKNHKPKNRVSMHLNVQVGSLKESEDQQGLAHFLEHMLFNGSTHFKPGELVKYFQSIGMDFGPDANARTGFNQTIYDILLPGGDRENLEQGLLVLKDYADGASLFPSEIQKERKVVLAEKRTRDSASYRTFISTLAFEFPEARLSERLPIGKEKVLKSLDRERAKAFYDTWYRPETMILVMVGDFDADLAGLLIKERFASLSPRAPPGVDPDLGKINHKGVNVFHHFEKEAGNTEVVIEVFQKIPKESDSLAFQKKWLQKNIADRIVMNRLNRMIGKPGTPFTSASIGSGLFLNQIEYAQIDAKCSPENWEKTLALIEQTLRKAITYGFTHTELERVKKDRLANLDDAVAKASTRDSRQLARSIIGHLNGDRVFQSPAQEKALFSPYIHTLTVSDVQDIFKRTWSPGHRLVLVTGNVDLRGGDLSPEKKIIQAFHASRKQTVKRPIEKKTAAFPYLPVPEKEGSILSRTRIPDLEITQVDFENGVRLNIKKTDFKADQILVNLSFGNGRSSEPPHLSGLSDLSVGVINESGLGSLEKDELSRALAGKKTRVWFKMEEDRFVFTGETTPKEAPLLFQLLYAQLTDPGRRTDAYTLVMNRFHQRYQSLSRSVDGAVKLYGKRFFAGGDTRFGLPSYEEFKNLKLEDVSAWINGPLKRGKLELSVVGDIDPDAITAFAARYLGSLPERTGEKPQKGSRWPVFPESKVFKVNVDTEIPKGLVIVAYPTDDFWDIHRTRRLSVLASVFSDRLRVRVREKTGAAYSPFAFNRSSRAYPGYGLFQAYVSVNPEQTDMVIDEIKRITTDLAINGVTNDELNRAINPMVTGIKDMRRNNSYWLNSVLTGSMDHPGQLEWSRTIMSDYASVTVEQLSKFAKQYLNNDKTAILIVKPAG